MALSGRAWAITGSKTPANIARMVANAATAGGNGVVGPGHLYVTATPTPSGSVRIYPGTAVMASRYPGSSFESYVDRNDAAVDFPITPTGSAGGRTDYLIVRVEDPAFPGQVAPADRINGPYTRFATLTTDPRVSPPAYPFVLLAKIAIPANTGTITAAMIDSGPGVRELANPRSKTVPALRAWNETNLVTITAVANDWSELWIDTTTLEIPDWATTATVQIIVAGVHISKSGFLGKLRANFAFGVSPEVDIDVNATATDSVRTTLVTGGRIAIAKAYRGTNQRIVLQVRKTGGAGELRFRQGTTVLAQVTFQQSAVDEQV